MVPPVPCAVPCWHQRDFKPFYPASQPCPPRCLRLQDPGLAGSCTHCIVPVFPGSPDRCGWQTLPSALRHGSAAAGAVQFVTESWVVDSMEAGRWLAGAEGQHQPPPPALPAAHAAVPRSGGLMRSPSLEPFEDEAAPDMFSLLNWNIWWVHEGAPGSGSQVAWQLGVLEAQTSKPASAARDC